MGNHAKPLLRGIGIPHLLNAGAADGAGTVTRRRGRGDFGGYGGWDDRRGGTFLSDRRGGLLFWGRFRLRLGRLLLLCFGLLFLAAGLGGLAGDGRASDGAVHRGAECAEKFHDKHVAVKRRNLRFEVSLNHIDGYFKDMGEDTLGHECLDAVSHDGAVGAV